MEIARLGLVIGFLLSGSLVHADAIDDGDHKTDHRARDSAAIVDAQAGQDRSAHPRLAAQRAGGEQNDFSEDEKTSWSQLWE